ncbi:hypothetical protein FUAX_07060 [Fulvitalea axinellae]|uniref:MFS transporter n=2 Tax=Fulvitalea axinellae TaxID=1182444 RepID=A0AAU9CPI7_9BACT|nr:hypothetical protein FUAX_07060 [Fulvitalea axinellae]
MGLGAIPLDQAVSEKEKSPNPGWGLGATAGSLFLNQLSYYGVLGIFTIYLLKVHGWSRESLAIFYTAMVVSNSVSRFVAGIVSDLWLTHKGGTILGYLLSVIGFALLYSAIPGIALWLGLICVCLGGGLVNVNIRILIGRMYLKSDSKRHIGFSLNYIGSVLSFLLGNMAILVFGYEQEQMRANILTATILSGAGFLLFFLLKGKIREVELDSQLKLSTKGLGWIKSVALLALLYTIVTIIAGGQLSHASGLITHDEPDGATLYGMLTGFSMQTTIIATGVVIALVAVLNKPKIRPFLMAGFILCLVTAIPSSALNNDYPDPQTVNSLLFLSFALFAVADSLITPVAYSQLTRYLPVKWASTSLGLIELITGCSIYFGMQYFPKGIDSLVTIMIVFGLTGLALTVRKRFFTKLLCGLE